MNDKRKKLCYNTYIYGLEGLYVDSNLIKGAKNMTVTTKIDGTKLTAAIEGRLDTATTPAAEAELKDKLDGITELTLDFKSLDYISSSGLRLLLALQKKMNKQGSMTVINSNEAVKEIFEVTGFSDILTIE